MNQPHSSWRTLCLVVAVLSLCGAASARIITPESSPAAQPAGAVTVVLADGWELAGVTVEWLADDGLLIVNRPDGATRTLRPEDLAGLRDQVGRDVTAEMLPRWAVDRLGGALPPASPPRPAPRPIPSPEPAPPAVAPAPEKPQRILHEFGGARSRIKAGDNPDPRVVFSLDMGYSVPRDGHFGGYEGGLGFEGLLRMQLAGPFYLSGGYLYQTLQVDDHMVVDWNCIPEDVGCYAYPGYDTDGEARLHGAWAGLSLVSTAERGNPVRFYLDGGLGRFKADGMAIWNRDDAYLGYRFATGFMIPVGDSAAFNLGFRAVHVPNLDFGWNPETSHTMLGAQVGLSLFGF